MITHNGTYLPFATHHGMPIYAATMGGKMVIGYGLLSATMQAIMAAFGSAEGTEVIAKTNDYLNRIATTDPQRALLLTNFINEDPLLVTSLVETSKVRTATPIQGQLYNAKIDLYTATDLRLVVKCAYTGETNGSSDNIIGGYKWNSSWNKMDVGSFGISYDMRGGAHIDYATEHQWYDTILRGSLSFNTPYIIDADYSRCIVKNIDGKQLAIQNNTYYWTHGNERQMSIGGRGVIWYFGEVWKNSELIKCFVPFQAKDGNCFVDIITGTKQPLTEGAFTIALTDKTTS